jgi:hypothetical protein
LQSGYDRRTRDDRHYGLRSRFQLFRMEQAPHHPA